MLDAEHARRRVQEAAQALQGRLGGFQPEVAVILGSGLGGFVSELSDSIEIPYDQLPHFPVSTVAGHAGKWVAGTVEGRSVLCMQGRFHYYEGYSMQEVTFPIRVMKELNIGTLIVTNAAGGIRASFQPGDLMLIEDHINWMFDNPLRGPNVDEWGPRFPDMSHAYDPDLIACAEKVAADFGITLHRGVYIAVPGPSYETPAEIRAFAKLGADAVGMSTVPEVIVANHQGMKVLGISCISNMASGILPEPLSHEDVVRTSQQVQGRLTRLVKGVLKELGR